MINGNGITPDEDLTKRVEPDPIIHASSMHEAGLREGLIRLMTSCH